MSAFPCTHPPSDADIISGSSLTSSMVEKKDHVVLGRMVECTAQFSASARQAPHGSRLEATADGSRFTMSAAAAAEASGLVALASTPLTMGACEVEGDPTEEVARVPFLAESTCERILDKMRSQFMQVTCLNFIASD